MYRYRKPSESCRIVNPNLHKMPDLFWWVFSLSRIFTDLIMHNYRSNQSVLMARCGTDFRHQYGIFCGESKTSFTRNATPAEEGRLLSQAIIDHSRITSSLFFKASLAALFFICKINSHENEFNLRVNENWFANEKMGTKTCFEKEAWGNSEMAYCLLDVFHFLDFTPP